MAAYAFARLEFPGRNVLFGLVLFQMMVPPQLLLFRSIWWLISWDAWSIFALVFPGTVSAFGTFLLRQFFVGHSGVGRIRAKLDGCNISQTFFKIMLPLAKSGLIALAIFTALCFQRPALAFDYQLQCRQGNPVQCCRKFKGAIQLTTHNWWPLVFLSIWPMVTLYIIFQKQFIQGIATSGGKLWRIYADSLYEKRHKNFIYNEAQLYFPCFAPTGILGNLYFGKRLKKTSSTLRNMAIWPLTSLFMKTSFILFSNITRQNTPAMERQIFPYQLWKSRQQMGAEYSHFVYQGHCIFSQGKPALAGLPSFMWQRKR